MRLSDDQVTTSEVKGWKGLHLLHFQASSCSQKVRILLREKGIDWVSHPVDLMRNENTRPWFLGINPRGVVPVLVHDGAVHVESNDILEYLDALPSGADSFFPRDAAERSVVKRSLALEDSLHMDLRTITMGFLAPQAVARKSPGTLAEFESGGAPDPHRDREVVWWRDFARQGIPPEQARASAAAFEATFRELDGWLGERPWLIGDRISVLEIAWFIQVFRLSAAGYPMQLHPRLNGHYETLLARPGFAAEVAPRGLPGVAMRLYGAYRRWTGTTLRETLEAAS